MKNSDELLPLREDEASEYATEPRRRSYGFYSLLGYSILCTILICGRAIYDLRRPIQASSLPDAYSTEHSPSHILGDFNAGIRYRPQTFPHNAWESSVFIDPPAPDVEQAWNRLIYANRIAKGIGNLHSFRITADEARALSIDWSLPAPADNYTVVMGVTHNLHCLWLYLESYYSDYPADFLEEEREHMLHCVEALRTSVTCHPDLSILPFIQSDGVALSEINHLRVAPAQTCMVWESLNEVLYDRMGDVELA